MTDPAAVPACLASGHRAIWYDILPSTNSRALELAGDAAFESCWICAREQTEGRGRAGRSWYGGSGNLQASFVFRPDCGLEHAAHLPIVTAVACRSALSTALLQHQALPDLQDLQVKWPNDVLLKGTKISGILIETQQIDGVLWVVIGIGINVATVPDGIDQPAASLVAQGAAMDADRVLELLSLDLQRALQIWDRGNGFDRIREMWLRYAANLGSEVEAGTVSGIFIGLDEAGGLLLKTKAGIQTITHGDVTPGNNR